MRKYLMRALLLVSIILFSKLSFAQDLVGGRWYMDKKEFISDSFSSVIYEKNSSENITDLSMISACFLADSVLKVTTIHGKYLIDEYLFENDSLSMFGAPKSRIEWNDSNSFISSFDGNWKDTTFQTVSGTMHTTFKRAGTNCDCAAIFVNSISSEPIIGSLKTLIQSACKDQIIRFDSALNEQVILFDSIDDEIEITKDIRIKGNGITNTIIDGGAISRIFKVLPNVNLWLYDLTLKNGFAITNGGAILNEGNLILENVDFENNFEQNTEKGFTNINEGKVVVYPTSKVEIK